MNIKKQKQKTKQKIGEFFIGILLILLFFASPILTGILAEILSKYAIEKIFIKICYVIAIVSTIKFFKD